MQGTPAGVGGRAGGLRLSWRGGSVGVCVFLQVPRLGSLACLRVTDAVCSGGTISVGNDVLLDCIGRPEYGVEANKWGGWG